MARQAASCSKEEVLRLLEGRILDFATNLAQGQLPRWEIPRRTRGNSEFVDGTIVPAGKEFRVVDGTTAAGLLKFTRVAFVMFRCYQQLSANSSTSGCTKRDLFYQNPKLFGDSQVNADAAIEDLCSLLNVPRRSLGISASPKGQIAGPGVKLRTESNLEVTLSPSATTEITDELSSAKIVDSEAEFVLVVEKEASFNTIVKNGFLSTWPCVLITGKGYPDLATRRLTRRIAVALKIPVFALVDADPYGMDIFLTYRFGSLGTMKDNNELTVPSMIWLGVKPTDIALFAIPRETRVQLSDSDRKKMKNLLRGHPAVRNSHVFRHELEVQESLGEKVEIESLDAIDPNYLCDIYLPRKFSTMGYRFKKFFRCPGQHLAD